MGTHHLEVVATDSGDTDLVGGAGEEGGEGGAEGQFAAAGHAGSDSNHVLFGDETFHEAFGVFVSHGAAEGTDLGVSI